MLISCSVLLRMSSVLDNVVKKIRTHIFCSVVLYRNPAVNDEMWKNNGRVGQATYDNIIWRMRIACWIPKPTDTHWKYVRFIAFLWQWLRERASLLGHTYSVCLLHMLVRLRTIHTRAALIASFLVSQSPDLCSPTSCVIFWRTLVI